MNEHAELTSILNSVISKVEVRYYIEQNKRINNLIFEYEDEIKYLKKHMRKNESKIYKTCEHVWEKDYDDYYSRYKICHKCKLSNMPYVYK
tara:strand:- start:201 stop:473 length:273 start_codon:yes stop_codon:yes gene_type:complete